MNWISIISFVVILVGVYMFAFKKSRKVNTQDAEGYFLGGRSLVGITVGMSIIMTNLSTEQLVGQNGQSYAAGMEVMAWEVTAAIAIVIGAWLFIPNYLKYGINTISDFIEIRFDATTKRIVSILFIFTYVASFMPVVLYSGSLIFNNLFGIDEILGVSSMTAVVIITFLIGAVGVVYLLAGGLSLIAHSDSVYGVGLIVGGLLITILAFIFLGDSSLLNGIDKVITNTPEKLNAWGALDSDIVPWPTLFFGMLFNNLYFWCTNQMIVQKSLAAKNLKEAQKGMFYVGFFKIIGAFFLVLPGIIAFNIFGGDISMDNAYPSLIAAVLPEWSYGIFGAVVFGAIMSSFVGALNATVTLFSLDFYKPIIKKDATSRDISRIGKMATVGFGLVTIVIAPVISIFPQGLYAVLQEFNGVFNIPLLAIILVGFFSKRVSARGAKITFAFHVIAYASTKVIIPDINYLYVWSVIFFIDLFILLVYNNWKPDKEEFDFDSYRSKVDLTPWVHSKWVGTVIIGIVVLMYVVFSPLVLAA